MIRSLLIFFIVLMLASFGSAQKNIIRFMHDDGIYLRWQGYRKADMKGYHVYRKQEGSDSWIRLNDDPLKMLNKPDDIKALLGYKSPMYFGLFGKKENETITPKDFPDDKNNEAASLFEAMCLVNPEYGRALGEIFHDKTAIKGVAYQYKVTVLHSGEEDWAATEMALYHAQVIDKPKNLEAVRHEDGIELVWLRNKEMLSRGDIVAYVVYRRDHDKGEYLKQNLYNTLPVSVAEKGKVTDDFTSWKDNFIKQGSAYDYRVTAVNAFGIEGQFAEVKNVRAMPAKKDMQPRDLSAVLIGSSVKISWKSQFKGDLVFTVFTSTEKNAGYKEVFTTPSLKNEEYFWLDTKALNGSDYFCFVSSNDVDEKLFVYSDTVHVFFQDTHRPGKPTGLKAESVEGGVRLSWQAVKDKDLAGYYVEVSEDSVNARTFVRNHEPLKETTWFDKLDLHDENTYFYRIVAEDVHLNRSFASDVVSAKAPDRTPPSAPVLISAIARGDTVLLHWKDEVEIDFLEYHVYRMKYGSKDATRLVKTDVKEYKDMPGMGKYEYYIVSVDKDGNVSLPGNALGIELKKSTIVQAPVEGEVTADKRNLLLSWELKQDTRRTGISISRRDLTTGQQQSIGQFAADLRLYHDLYVDIAHEYVYDIRCFDQDYQMSTPLILHFIPAKK